MTAVPASRLWADAASPGAIPDTVAAVDLSGKSISLTAADIKDFRAGLAGQLFLRTDAGYEQARKVWNGAFDRHPALVVRCHGTVDVIRAVDFARTHGLLTAVHAGGHSISGASSCDGGIMIDLSPMKGIRVDPVARVAEAQGGVLLGELDRETTAFGLATPLGTAPDTGIAGLTLGGGMGRLNRMFGLACDNLVGVDIVTANGKLLHASSKENADLFWGIRGGGGNFGVVTSFEYRLHAVGPLVLDGTRFYPYNQARAVFAALKELAESAPDELGLSAGFSRVQAGFGQNPAGLPPGRYVGMNAFHYGDPRQGLRLLEPLKKLGTPLLDAISAKTYLAAQRGDVGTGPVLLTPGLPAGMNAYDKTGYLRSIPAGLTDEIVKRLDTAPPWVLGLDLSQMGGAVARVKPDATAYWNRDGNFIVTLFALWLDPAHNEQNIRTARELWDGIEPFTKGYYVNLDTHNSDQRLRANYGENYPRLVALKDKYDPMNLFRLNANIRPSAHA
ncbi:MAG TPA: FAD-binding oxidoreductase [Steroidobacteraceae bacterium]